MTTDNPMLKVTCTFCGKGTTEVTYFFVKQGSAMCNLCLDEASSLTAGMPDGGCGTPPGLSHGVPIDECFMCGKTKEQHDKDAFEHEFEQTFVHEVKEGAYPAPDAPRAEEEASR